MTIDRVEALMEMLEKKSFHDFQKFCDALEKTGQGRLLKEGLSSVRESDDQSAVINSDSIDGSFSLLCSPLSFMAQYLLKKHWNTIVETMVTDADVFGKLTEKKVFTEFQLKSIKVVTTLDSQYNQCKLLFLQLKCNIVKVQNLIQS